MSEVGDVVDDLSDAWAFDEAVSGNVRNPYPEFERFRAEEPVQRIDLSVMPGEEGKPLFVVYRFEEAQQLLRDNETFSSSIILSAYGEALGKRVMLGMDEPEHGRHRALVAKAFSQKGLARFQDELVGRVANDLIDRMAPNGKANLVKEFTFPYPTRVIAGLLGLPEEDFLQFQKKWSLGLLSYALNPSGGVGSVEGVGRVLPPDTSRAAREPARRPHKSPRCSRS